MEYIFPNFNETISRSTDIHTQLLMAKAVVQRIFTVYTIKDWQQLRGYTKYLITNHY